MWNVFLINLFVYIIYLLVGGVLFFYVDDFYFEEPKLKPCHNCSLSFIEMKDILMKKNFTKEDILKTAQNWCPKELQAFYSFNRSNEDVSWTYVNAFMFAFYILSTIGYGDIFPKTITGQMFCIAFGIIGIPINTLFINAIANSFSEAQMEVQKGLQDEKTNSKFSFLPTLVYFSFWITTLVIFPSIVFMFTEEWDFPEGMYFSIITLTTVGFGDYNAGGTVHGQSYYIAYKIILFLWMIYGLSFFSMITETLTRLYSKFLLFSIETKMSECKIKFIRIPNEELSLNIINSVSNGNSKCEFSKTSIFGEDDVVKEVNMKDLANTTERLISLINDELEKRRNRNTRKESVCND